MNEPKRRGRPPKARIEGADVIDLPVVEQPAANLSTMAQAYALRVWSGQSPNVPRNERIRRVMAALNGQNLPTEGVELP
jgi:hypothetical protein